MLLSGFRMAITLIEYQVLYLLLHFLKFLLDLLLQRPCVVSCISYSASKTTKSQHDILTCISYQPSQIFYITHVPTMFLSCFVTILLILFFLLLFLVSFAYTKNYFGFNLSLFFIPQYVWRFCTPILCHQSCTMPYNINICPL